MKKVASIKNQYLGINAHLHSFWQKMGGWKEFHPSHIVDSHPYRIWGIDPRPKLYAGKAVHYEFDVDEPIPVVKIPLNDSDSLLFDFGPAYHKTLAETFFAYEFVDYSQYPVNFERYSPEDRQRIATRMVAISEAAKDKVDLESGPFERPEISLEEAVRRIDLLRRE